MQQKSKYNYKELQDKWNRAWEDARIYHPNIDNAKKPYYVLYMFPYPSAEGLHVGHAFSGTGADVYARFKRMKGFDVFHPMGFDAFGIHSENFALKIGDHPQNLINRATKHFREQFDSLGFSYDWDHSVNTSNPDYYRWTQWLFIQLFKAGLAQKKKAEVNWCPSCKTVLADEQVLQESRENREERVGVCERCGSEVERKELEQWFFKITDYADKLLEGLTRIDWTEKVKLAQKNWIGKSEGLLFTAPVKDTKLSIDTFSAHFQAFYADTFVVIAPDHPRLSEIIEGVPNRKEIEDFCKKIIKNRKTEILGKEKEPEGIFTGRYIVDPIGNGDLPIWVANFAIKEYGTGIVKCSAHDERDFAFAKKYKIRLKPVLFPPDPKEREKVKNLEYCYTDMENGILSEPEEFEGKRSGEITEEIIKYAVKKGFAKPVSHYHLRDWLISRQRYWGVPIPMIHCPKDGWQPVKEKDLPVILPYIENFKPLGTGIAPLAVDEDFVNVKCPVCDGPAKRETDVADTFLDSSWYFLRYPSVGNDHLAFDSHLTEKWLPVPMYIGGAEHSVLHLLYSRFITKVLFELDMIDFDEPFTKFRAHGLIIKDGAKMSKSRGNVVNPDEYVAKYGADAMRCYLMFLGPFDQGGDFRDSGIEGMERFLKRVKKLIEKQLNEKSANFSGNPKMDKLAAKTLSAVENDLDNLRYNTAIAKIMEFLNDLNRSKDDLSLKYVKLLVFMLAPFAPYLSEELWEKILKVEKKEWQSIHVQPWPSYNEADLVSDEIKLAVQVNGKLRGLLNISAKSSREEIESMAKRDQNISKYIEGQKIKQIIYIPGKVLNFVV